METPESAKVNYEGTGAEALADAPMDAALAAELEDWQTLGQESLRLFPFEENDG